jgi:hypothetical protein
VVESAIMEPNYHWGLTVAEWLTILAIMLGPVLAVATQLWMQRRKSKRDQKLWVFSTLMGLRASYYVNETAVQAFNLIDVVFYRSTDIREKRKEFLAIVNASTERDMTSEEIDKTKDLMSEMLAKMGRELGFDFDHTQIKDLAYYPKGLMTMPEAILSVLKGRTNIGVVVRDETPVSAMRRNP